MTQQARPQLVLVAHGSRDPSADDTIERIAARVRTLLPDVPVLTAYLDHQEPSVADVVDEPTVLVPLLLASGWHVEADVPAYASRDVHVTAALGPDDMLVTALRDRLSGVGHDGSAPVVLGAAGSRAPDAGRDVAAMADALRGHEFSVVEPAFVTTEPKVSDVVARFDRCTVASYFLAPGSLYARLVEQAGTQPVTSVIGDHPVVAEIVVRRYADVLPSV